MDDRLSATATLFVLVQDVDGQPVADAVVTVSMPEIPESFDVAYEKSLQRHMLSGLSPGTHKIEVKGPDGTREEHRELTLQAGENHVVVMVAEPGLPQFKASGMSYYFRPAVGVMLLSVKRAKTQQQVTDILDAAELQYEVLPDRSGRVVDDDLLLLIAVGEGAEAKRNQATLRSLQRSELSKNGLRSRLALAGKVRDEISFGITDEIIVRFQSWVTAAQRKKIAAKYGLFVQRNITYLGSGFLYQHKGSLDYSVLETLDALHGLREVIYAEPNLLLRLENYQHTPNDYLYPEVPHLGLIRCDIAWETLGNQLGGDKGGSPEIIIGVLERDGVDPDHPELTGPLSDGAEKMIANFDFNNMTNQDPADVVGNHGTQSAGSASAKMDDDIGIPGVAPNCRLVCGRMGDSASILEIGDMLIWMAGFPTGSVVPDFPAPVSEGADILSNSWGIDSVPTPEIIADVFDYLTTYGRGGRGCLVCFAAGNDGHVSADLAPFVSDPKSLGVGASISVNPTDPCNSMHVDHNGLGTNLPAVVDTRAYYSRYGMSVDLVAPSSTSLIPSGIGGSLKVDPILAPVVSGDGHWPGSAATQTTITANALIGDDDVSVTDSTGFLVGDSALFGGPGASPNETKSIIGVASGQLTVRALPLEPAGLANAYPVDTVVATGPSDYDMHPYFGFGGTSHACPTVAGAAALLLSVKPDLNWLELRRLLTETAAQIDAGQTNAIGQWFDRDGDDFSLWYGYGRLDVGSAVDAAIALDQRSDVVLRDNLNDDGTVPSVGWHAHSPDLWVRNAIDTNPPPAYDAAPPHQNPRYGQDNYVYMRVRNFGNATVPLFYVRALIVHWPGIEFQYPDDWQPTPRPGELPSDPLVPGSYLIGEEQINDLAPGDSTIVSMLWPEYLIPPVTVTVDGEDVNWHPCLLGEVSPHDGPAPAGSGYPVRRNNNIAQRNLSIGYPGGSSRWWFMSAVFAGTRNRTGTDSIVIDRSRVPPECAVIVRAVDPKLMGRWKESGKDVRLVERRKQKVLLIANGKTPVKLPLRLPGGKFAQLLVGIEHCDKKKTPDGTVRVSQIRRDGEVSPGYEIRAR